MAEQQKDVIYIDIDDEITSVIDKLRASKARIVALVPPKRATMLQSSVNMKLLKKAADVDKKRLVLITSETGLLPLAGSVGLYVAKTLQSKPEVPEAPVDAFADNTIDSLEESPTDKDFDAKAVADKPVGDLAALPEDETATAKPELTPRPIPRAGEPDETIELDNAAAAATEDSSPKGDDKPKKPKNKKLKVPNFNKFRLRLIIGVVVLILLIVGWILANSILPKASVTIATQTSTVTSNLTLTLSTTASSLDPSNATVPAHLQQTQKTESQTVPTTGQKNEGTVASGTATLVNCSTSGNPITVPAGTGLIANGQTYLTQSAAQLPTSTFSFGGNCKATSASSATVNISAQSPGAAFNTTGTATAFSVNGYSDVDATGSATGGTDNIVQTVTQTDINTATQKLASEDTNSVKSGLQSALQQAGYYAITGTFTTGAPSITTSANVGDQASTVTATQTTTYTMFGVQANDLQTLLDTNLDSQINTAKQRIQNDGFSSASFSVLSQTNTGAQVTMQATGIAGPQLQVASLKTQIAGEKTGDVISTIGADPGVTSVKVHLSPFWVGSVPKKTSKITIIFQSSGNASNT